MRELVRAPYMAIRAVSTRTALPRQILTNLRRTTVSPGDFLSPGLPPPPPAAGYKLFFHVLPYRMYRTQPCFIYMHANRWPLDIYARVVCTHVDRRSRESKSSIRVSRFCAGELGSANRLLTHDGGEKRFRFGRPFVRDNGGGNLFCVIRICFFLF